MVIIIICTFLPYDTVLHLTLSRLINQLSAQYIYIFMGELNRQLNHLRVRVVGPLRTRACMASRL